MQLLESLLFSSTACHDTTQEICLLYQLMMDAGLTFNLLQIHQQFP